MWNWPKSEHFKYELLSILGDMKEKESEYEIDAIENLQYAISLSVIAVEQHCQNWIMDDLSSLDCDIHYQETIYEFVKKVNKILSEEQWSFA